MTLNSNNEKYIDKLIERFQIEHQKNDRSGVYALTQKMLAYNSNKIEGSTLTENQTASLFETGTVYADGEIIKAKDIEEMTGHFSMFNEMLKSYDQPLSHELIKKYHFRLKSGVFEDLANGYAVGEYKRRSNMVSNIVTASPQDVFNAMDDLINEYNKKTRHTIEDIAKLHADYEKIHPFQDGNGRTGRILIFKECLKNKVVPLVIPDEDKVRYYLALNLAQTQGDYTALIQMFYHEQERYYEKTKDFVIDSKELKGISANKEKAKQTLESKQDVDRIHKTKITRER